jgi:hypothetical protein
MPRGGKRPNAGAKKGSKHKATISKEQAREALRHIVLAHMDEMTAAQVSNAKGIRYLVVRQKSTGKFLRRVGATGETHNPDTEIIEIWEKDPSVQAFTDLMNRALDKPKEQELEVKLSGDEALIAALLAGRKRAAEARKAE